MWLHLPLADCEECGQKNRGDCPIHGPLTPLDESLGVDEASKQFTCVPVPKQLTVKPSSIPDAGMGVYAKEYIPKGTRCGPYKGTIVDKMDIGADVNTAYMWEVTLYMHTYTAWSRHYTASCRFL